MKKIFVISAVFAVAFLIVSCGGSTNKSEAIDNGEKPDSDEQDSDADDSAECESGEFKCADSESLYCNSFGSWVFDARCENGCDPVTGKCKTDLNDSDIADTENENDGDYENSDTSDSGDDSDIENSNTDSNSDNDHEIPDDSGCTNGKYKCSDTGYQSFLCSDGLWNINETCNYGCDFSTGKCKGFRHILRRCRE